MFKFLEEKGARSSRRILHVAVETAAGRGADPYCEVPVQSPGGRARNMGDRETKCDEILSVLEEWQWTRNQGKATRTPYNVCYT